MAPRYFLAPLGRLLFIVGLLGLTRPAVAQPEAYHWKFGDKAGITFPGGGPAIVNAPGAMTVYEGCATISDTNGVLQCYSNGQSVWDRAGTMMPNGQFLPGSNLSATQGALLLRGPGQTRLYYLFTVDAVENNLQGGLRYSTIDMSLRAGLGDVTTKAMQLPGAGLVTEKLTAVLHANGRDYWIIVHGWLNNAFYTYLLSPGGLSMTPVVSTVGVVHSGGLNGNVNALGYLRASPDSRLLAAAQYGVGIELFDFNPATGEVSNAQPLPRAAAVSYGLEFSPDNTKLYASDGQQLMQLDLANNRTWTNLPVAGGKAQTLQRGPDGQIYIATVGTSQLSIIHKPNAAGLACNLEVNAFSLAPNKNVAGLPNFPNAFPESATINPIVSGCPGSLVTISTSFGAPAGSVFSWDFGDPASGPANAGTGPTVTHRYQTSGSFKVSLTVTVAGRVVAQAEQTVVVAALPSASLGSRQQTLCAGQTLVLIPGPLSTGTTVRWQDGTTTPVYVVRQPGHYVVQLTTAQGCFVRDSVDVSLAPSPQVRLSRDTALCTEWQPVLLRANTQPAGSTYRWQDGSTAAEYVARQPGLYWLQVSNAAGCAARDSVVVRAAGSLSECPAVVIPNVITPNNDSRNDFFVLQGLSATEWNLTVYNRWGRPVFQQDRYANDWAATGQPAGMYYYTLQSLATRQQFRGWVEVVR